MFIYLRTVWLQRKPKRQYGSLTTENILEKYSWVRGVARACIWSTHGVFFRFFPVSSGSFINRVSLYLVAFGKNTRTSRCCLVSATCPLRRFCVPPAWPSALSGGLFASAPAALPSSHGRHVIPRADPGNCRKLLFFHKPVIAVALYLPKSPWG